MLLFRIPFVLFALALALAFVSGAAVAGGRVAPINTDRKGVALHGYDRIVKAETYRPNLHGPE